MAWMMRSFFQDVPKEIEEAVSIDDGTWWTSFFVIASRIVLPRLAASAVLAFIYAWNTFMCGLILAERDTQALTAGLLHSSPFKKSNGVRWPPA